MIIDAKAFASYKTWTLEQVKNTRFPLGGDLNLFSYIMANLLAEGLSRVELLRYFLEEHGAEFQVVAEELICRDASIAGSFCIHHAVASGDLASVSYLLDRFPELYDQLTDPGNSSVLHYALEQPVVLEFLCQDPHCKNYINDADSGSTPLSYALTLSPIPEASVRILLENGARVNDKDLETLSGRTDVPDDLNKLLCSVASKASTKKGDDAEPSPTTSATPHTNGTASHTGAGDARPQTATAFAPPPSPKGAAPAARDIPRGAEKAS